MRKDLEKRLESGVIEEHRGPGLRCFPWLRRMMETGIFASITNALTMQPSVTSTPFRTSIPPELEWIDNCLCSKTPLLAIGRLIWTLECKQAPFVIPFRTMPKVITFGLMNASAAFQRSQSGAG